jgi:hypothetical protein
MAIILTQSNARAVKPEGGISLSARTRIPTVNRLPVGRAATGDEDGAAALKPPNDADAALGLDPAAAAPEELSGA